jgi:hypothetical protein
MIQSAARDPDTNSDSPFAITGPIRVLALDARSGRQVGDWQGSRQTYKTAPGELLKLVPVPLGTGEKPAVMLMVRDAQVAPQTVLLDAQLRERALPESPGFDWSAIRVPRAADLGGDGSNDLVFECELAVWAVRGGTGEVLWRWPTTSDEANATKSGTWSVRDILARPNGGSAIPVLHLRRDDSGQGNLALDGQTGKPLWRFQGWPVIGWVRQGLEGSPLHAHSPLVVRHLPNEEAVAEGTSFGLSCEMSLPADQTGKYKLPETAPLSFAPAAAYPWELRSLPWTLGPTATGTALVRIGGFASAHAFMLVIVPGWLLVWAVRNRTWTMSGLLGLPLIAAIAMAFVQYSEANSIRLDDLQIGRPDSVGRDNRLSVLCYRINPAGMTRDYNNIGFVPSDAEGRLIRLSAFAAAGLPVLAFPYLLLAGLLRQRWWRVGVLLSLSCLLSVAVASLLLWDDRQWLASFQHYSNDGWYFVWFIGAYLTTLLFLVEMVGHPILLWIARRTRVLLRIPARRAGRP